MRTSLEVPVDHSRNGQTQRAVSWQGDRRGGTGNRVRGGERKSTTRLSALIFEECSITGIE